MFQSITNLPNAFLCFRLQRTDLAVYSVTFHLQANTNLPYTLTDTTLYPGAIDTWRNSRWFPDSKCLSGFIMLANAFICTFQSKTNHQESQYMVTLSDFYNSCFLLKYERQRWSQILSLCGDALIHRSHRAIGHHSCHCYFPVQGGKDQPLLVFTSKQFSFPRALKPITKVTQNYFVNLFPLQICILSVVQTQSVKCVVTWQTVKASGPNCFLKPISNPGVHPGFCFPNFYTLQPF